MNKRKVGGILTELSVNSAGKVDFAVIGIGINCNGDESIFPQELRSIASTLTCVTGVTVDRCKLIAAMIEELETLAQRLLSRRKEYLQQYRKDCITLGQEVRIHSSEGISHGVAQDIDDAGGLIVALADGTTRCVSSGEVSVRGLYGYAN
jgi:BirA family biotin operon repressor/biotin-[acetyl-CoA-carboxylase] ligase